MILPTFSHLLRSEHHMLLAQGRRHQRLHWCWAQRHHLAARAQQHGQGGGRRRGIDFVELQGRGLGTKGILEQNYGHVFVASFRSWNDMKWLWSLNKGFDEYGNRSATNMAYDYDTFNLWPGCHVDSIFQGLPPEPALAKQTARLQPLRMCLPTWNFKGTATKKDQHGPTSLKGYEKVLFHLLSTLCCLSDAKKSACTEVQSGSRLKTFSRKCGSKPGLMGRSNCMLRLTKSCQQLLFQRCPDRKQHNFFTNSQLKHLLGATVSWTQIVGTGRALRSTCGFTTRFFLGFSTGKTHIFHYISRLLCKLASKSIF